jgi:uncharacterized CHY-type Zn-finger protein
MTLQKPYHNKSDEMKKFLESTAEGALVKLKLCPFCQKPIKEKDFRDELSIREYGISGLCQSCQDDFFGE